MALHSSSLRRRPFEGQPRMRWRNGVGETREVCAWPPGAGLDDFAWRVSVATIARSGPFSRFPGVTRTAVLIHGAGLRLHAGAARVELARPYAQATFDGASPWQCELMEEPVQVFNVMVRASLCATVRLAAGAAIAVPLARCRVAYAARGSTTAMLGAETLDLSEGDACVVCDAANEVLHVRPSDGDAGALVASIDPVGAA